jgi:hypothetical protein
VKSVKRNARDAHGVVHAVDMAPSSLSTSPGMTDCCVSFLWDRFEPTEDHVTCLMCVTDRYYAGGPGWTNL